MIEVQYVKLDDRAIEPHNAYGNDAGWDLFALDDTMIPEGGGVDIRTGLAVAIPEGYYGRIVARSSTMRKRGLMVLEGIIDTGFRGELFSYVYLPVGVGQAGMLVNSALIKRGESVAQLIVQEVQPIRWVHSTSLPQSVRGEKGFGSSGT